ncbi:MAG: mechanosensitive ion channel family protein [Chlorobi bacterium]|nr:mechanosensitive ion channel family protein [Chlorobiota bacterium]
MFHRPIRILFILLLVILAGYAAFPQESKPQIMISPEGDTITIKAIELSQITSSIEESYNTIKNVRQVLADNKDLQGFDSLYVLGMKYLKEEKEKILKNEDEFTLIQIDNFMKQWEANQAKADMWKTRIQKRVKILNDNLFIVSVLKEKWLVTYKKSRKAGVPENVLTSVSDLIVKLKDLEKEIKREQNKTLDMQNNITKVMLMIDQTLTELNKIQTVVQSDYLRQDSPPLWSAGDSTINPRSTSLLIKQSVASNQKSISLFFGENKNTMIFHVILFFLIWGILYLLYKQSDKLEAKVESEGMQTILSKSREIISRHVADALIIAMFLTLWLYPPMISSISKVIQLVFLIIAIIILPGFTNKKIKPFLYIVLVLYLINLFHVMIPGKTLFIRIILVVENILSAWLLYKIFKSVEIIFPGFKSSRWGFFVYLIPVFLLFLATSFIGNLIGFVNIALLLNNAVTDALISIVILTLAVMVFIATFSILIRMPWVLKSNLIRNHFTLTEKRIYQIIRIVGIWLWIKSVLTDLSLYSILYDWFTGLTSISWKVGKTTIELGGIINFFLIIIITYYVTRFIKIILNEEVFPRIRLPRGVPGAITMITGYFIAGYGLFLAIAAMGVDLGKFGLLAGTLGVGIGFGLQGIVANFIAGLVLAFERPIQVGDTIEVNGMMGDVVSIGVRSSSIRTFDGSEVIIPNSTLITNDVINWTLSDRKKRRDIQVGVAYGTDPHKVLEIIKKVANEHPNVLKTPAPWALFDGFGDSALNFRIRIWTTMDTGMTTKSEVAIAIYDALQEAGIQIPFPQHDLHLKSIDPEIEKVAFRKTNVQSGKKNTPETDKNK